MLLLWAMLHKSVNKTAMFAVQLLFKRSCFRTNKKRVLRFKGEIKKEGGQLLNLNGLEV